LKKKFFGFFNCDFSIVYCNPSSERILVQGIRKAYRGKPSPESICF